MTRSTSRSELRDAARSAMFLGSWRLVGMTTVHASGIEYPLGPAATGQIIYGADGRVAVHLCKDPAAGNVAMPDYTAYCGRYAIDLRAGTVVHHVEAASLPGFAGTDQVRRFELGGDRLLLSAATARGETMLEWRRTGCEDAPPPRFERLEAPDAFPSRAGRFWVADRDSEAPIVGTRIGPEQSNMQGFAHGGFMLAFADVATTMMVRGITLNLSADFLRPARIGDWLEARIVTRKRSAELIFADAVATCDGYDVLRISGLFRPFAART